MIIRVIAIILLTSFISFFLLDSRILALESDVIPNADFKMSYLFEEKSISINNSILPEEIDFKLPYQIQCSNISKGAIRYEWLIKYPSQDYVSVSTEKDPVLSINQYGPVYVKLRLNDLDNLSKEYFVSARNYLLEQKTNTLTESQYGLSNHTFNTKTTIETVSTYFSPKNTNIIMPKVDFKDPKIRGKSDFKISYYNGNTFYNVTNKTLPETVKTLPYKVSLTNIGKINSNFVWFIKTPGSEYVWMDDKQNVTATIWSYGTTFFKLAINGDLQNAISYSVTAYPPEKEELIKLTLNDANNKKRENPKVEFKLKYYGSNDAEIFDVTNATITNDFTKLPYMIFPLNLSKGDIKWEWLIKKPGDNEYRPITDLPIKIDCYGTVSIKLKINDNDNLTYEKNITSYFSL